MFDKRQDRNKVDRNKAETREAKTNLCHGFSRLSDYGGEPSFGMSVDDAPRNVVDGMQVPVGEGASSTGCIARGFGVGVALPAALTADEAPGVGIALDTGDGVEREVAGVMLSGQLDSIDDSLSCALGLPAPLTADQTPAPVFPGGFGLSFPLRLPAALAADEAPRLRAGFAFDSRRLLSLGELLTETEGVVVGLGVILAGGDSEGKGVNLAFGDKGGFAGGFVPRSQAAAGVDGVGEGVGSSLDLPAALAADKAPSLVLLGGGSDGCRVGRCHDGEDERKSKLHVGGVVGYCCLRVLVE